MADQLRRSMLTLCLSSFTLAIGPMAIAQSLPTTPTQTIPQRPDRAEADRQYQQGIAAYDRDEFNAALNHWETALKLYETLGDRKMIGRTLRQQGRAYHQTRDNSKAIDHFQRSLSIARKIGDRETEGRTLGNLGIIDAEQKKPELALQHYTQSITIAQAIGDKFGEAIAQVNLGEFHQYKDFSQAYRAFERSIALWRELKEPRREAYALLSRGNFFARWSGNCARAIEEGFAPSLPIFRQLADRYGQSRALGGIGQCHGEANRHDPAIQFTKESLVVTRAMQDRWYEGVLLNQLAKSHQALDEYDNGRTVRGFMSVELNEPPQSIKNSRQALAYAQRGLKIAREVKNRWGQAIALETVARSQLVLGEYQTSIAAAEERLTITREYQDWQNEATTLIALAAAHEGLGNYDRAIAQHQAAVAIYYKQYGDRINQPLSAGSDYIFFPHDLSNALIRMGDTYHHQGNYSAAITAYQDAQGKRERSTGSSGFILHGKLGRSLVKAKRFAEAEDSLRFANEFEDEFRQVIANDKDSRDNDRIRMAEILIENYRQLQQALIGQNRLEAALEIAEKSRARAFSEMLAARISGQPLLKNAALSAAPKVDQIRTIARQQNSTLVQYSFVEEDLLYIWVIQPNGAIAFKSVDLTTANQPIASLVQQSRRSMGVRSAFRSDELQSGKPPAGNPTPALQELHRLLIAPIAADLPADPNQRVVFLPQAALFLVPFPALQNLQGKHLIEQHTVSTAPSIQTLALTRLQRQTQPKSPTTQPSALIVGNPTMPSISGQTLRPLPGAEAEAKTIGQLLKTPILTGPQATKSTVITQMKTAPIVHLATHGLLDSSDETPGAIALAPSAGDSGLLRSSEIFDLKLAANLVVLSACDTGRGKITGDGVVGLSRSFVAAGVPSVVVSLWAVDDRSTALLMSEFYRQLQSNPNKALALRQAMLHTMKQHPQPIDWAAFTLIGEAE
jgi:CHAT domain-containing protein